MSNNSKEFVKTILFDTNELSIKSNNHLIKTMTSIKVLHAL
jgi:hypothetical protein